MVHGTMFMLHVVLKVYLLVNHPLPRLAVKLDSAMLLHKYVNKVVAMIQ